jgi:hypothetical protein
MNKDFERRATISNSTRLQSLPRYLRIPCPLDSRRIRKDQTGDIDQGLSTDVIDDKGIKRIIEGFQSMFGSTPIRPRAESMYNSSQSNLLLVFL